MIAQRSLVAIVLACLAGVASYADEPVKVKLGDIVVLELTGEQAKGFSSSHGSELLSDGSMLVTYIVSRKGNGVELKPTTPRNKSFFFEFDFSINWHGNPAIEVGARRGGNRKLTSELEAKKKDESKD